MTTFEEFFVKKKIDLSQLKADNQTLYEEFRNHYVQMGEKSFDHTKKFWFNRLRKIYLLKEVEIENPLRQEIMPMAVSAASQTSTSAPSVKPAGFKPRFKTGVTKTAEPEKTQETEPQEQQKTDAIKPVGFKPRFKAGITKTAEPEKIQKTEPQEEQKTDAVKPAGFKPRFKAGVTKTAEPEKTQETEPQEEQKTDAVKPAGFKPRFKAGVTKTNPPTTEDNT